MRRTGFAILAVLVLQLLWPRSADAWWGWIDELTGPKGLHGFQMDARVKCFAPEKGPRERVQPGAEPEASGGVSMCKAEDDLNRRLSINVGWRLFWATDTSPELKGEPEAYANGHRMYLFTVTPAVEYRFCSRYECNDKVLQPIDLLDVFDVGAGGGYYRISSDGFTPLQGATVEARITFHLPLSVSRSHRWSRVMPRFSFTRLGFVDGFDANAFGPKLTGEKALPKSAGGIDWTWQRAIYIDIIPRYQ